MSGQFSQSSYANASGAMAGTGRENFIAQSGMCSIAPPAPPRMNCHPAPWSSATGRKNHLIGEAYGASVLRQ